MKLSASLVSTAGLLLAATSASAASARKANVYIQPVSSSSSPHLLAEIRYDPFYDVAAASAAAAGQQQQQDASSSTASGAAEAAAEIISYEAPKFELDDDSDGGSDSTTASTLLRIGIYDPATASWVSSTSVLSSENFGKGYSPQILLSVDARSGDVVGAALKGVRIDAGQTRDFGPQVVLLSDALGKQPDLNKPVVLAPNGKRPEPEVEKTMLQK